MKIDALAGEPHYLTHLLPVWDALNPSIKGELYVDHRVMPNETRFPSFRQFNRRDSNPLLVAGFADLRRSAGRRVILMEHGTGQSYGADAKSAHHPAYAGGDGRHNVVAFLCPNEHCAQRNREAAPDRIVEIIGSPYLASLQGIEKRKENPKPVVAFSWHWDADVTSETRSGWRHFSSAVQEMARSDEFEILGHGHPRIMPDIAPTYRSWGVEVVSDFAEILARADVFVCDNSSAMFTFSYLRGPVVVMNPPWYRRSFHHGLRFWDAADIGPQVADPATIPLAVRQALSGEWPGREAALALVYPVIEDPAQRAANLIAGIIAQIDGLPYRERFEPTFPRSAASML